MEVLKYYLLQERNRLRIFIILLTVLFCYTNAHSKDISEYNGNDWIHMDRNTKASFILGVLLENSYVCENNVPFAPSSSDSYLGFIYRNKDLIDRKWLEITKIKNKKKPNYAHTMLSGLLHTFTTIKIQPDTDRFLFIFEKNIAPFASLKLLKEATKDDYSKIPINKLEQDYIILTVAYLTNLGIKENNNYLNQLQKYCLYNISVGQFIDGLDKFYQDFRNRDIRIGNAIYIVHRQIMGADDETIKRIIKYLKTGDINYYVDFPP